MAYHEDEEQFDDDREYRPSSRPQPGGDFAQTINEDIPDADLSDAIREGMRASMVDKAGRDVPDWRTRATFCRMAAEYKIGRPNERKGNEEAKQGRTLGEMVEHAKASPEYRASILETLQTILDQS